MIIHLIALLTKQWLKHVNGGDINCYHLKLIEAKNLDVLNKLGNSI